MSIRPPHNVLKFSSAAETVADRRVCIVGSGPAGFYAAKYLVEQKIMKNVTIKVDIIEKLPIPFGLVRYGVAPDHPEVKSVETTFVKVAANPNVRYFGNVEVGRKPLNGEPSVNVNDLEQVYDAVILAYGAAEDRHVGLVGEEKFSNVLPARRFVNWYNGHPEQRFDVSGLVEKAKHVVIIGNGNVALDCARVLAAEKDSLACTDIVPAALESLSKAALSLKSISIIGRRGAVQASFTIKELRELMNELPRARVRILSEEMELSLSQASLLEVESSRPKSRIMDLLHVAANRDNELGGGAVEKDSGHREALLDINLRFLLRPTELHPAPASTDTESGDKLESITFHRTTLSGPAHGQQAKDKTPPEKITLPCDLLLTSVGYRSLPLHGVPWNETSHTVPNVSGRVTAPLQGVGGLYVVGWLKRGPTGIIASAVGDAKETVQAVLHDLGAGCAESSTSRADNSSLDPVERIPALKAASVISWKEYGRIDEHEKSLGAATAPPKPRLKLTLIDDMLAVGKGWK